MSQPGVNVASRAVVSTSLSRQARQELWSG